MKTLRAKKIIEVINKAAERDPICQKNCLDVCVDYNNRWKEFHP